MKDHNCKHPILASSQGRRVGWFVMLTLVGCFLLQAIPANGQRTIETKRTPTDTKAIKASLTGSLSGKVYFYTRKSGGLMDLAPCIGNETFIRLVGSDGKDAAKVPIVPGKKGDKNAVCHYEFKDVMPGTYKLETIVNGGNLSGIQALGVLDERPFVIMNMDTHPEIISCTGGGNPCNENHRSVTISARKSSVQDLSVRSGSSSYAQ